MALRSLLARCRARIKTQADNWNWREIDMREGSGVLLFPKLSNTHSICQKAQKRLTAIWTSNIPNSYPFRCFCYRSHKILSKRYFSLLGLFPFNCNRCCILDAKEEFHCLSSFDVDERIPRSKAECWFSWAIGWFG